MPFTKSVICAWPETVPALSFTATTWYQVLALTPLTLAVLDELAPCFTSKVSFAPSSLSRWRPMPSFCTLSNRPR